MLKDYNLVRIQVCHNYESIHAFLAQPHCALAGTRHRAKPQPRGAGTAGVVGYRYEGFQTSGPQTCYVVVFSWEANAYPCLSGWTHWRRNCGKSTGNRQCNWENHQWEMFRPLNVTLQQRSRISGTFSHFCPWIMPEILIVSGWIIHSPYWMLITPLRTMI